MAPKPPVRPQPPKPQGKSAPVPVRPQAAVSRPTSAGNGVTRSAAPAPRTAPAPRPQAAPPRTAPAPRPQAAPPRAAPAPEVEQEQSQDQEYYPQRDAPDNNHYQDPDPRPTPQPRSV